MNFIIMIQKYAGSISGGKTNVKPFVEMHDQYRYGTGRISAYSLLWKMKRFRRTFWNNAEDAGNKRKELGKEIEHREQRG